MSASDAAQVWLSMTSRSVTTAGLSLGVSSPTNGCPGTGASMRTLRAASLRARSLASAVMRATLTPGPGSRRYWVTTGPGTASATLTWTLNDSNVSSIDAALPTISSSGTSPRSLGGQEHAKARQLPAAVLLRGRGGGRHSVGDANERLLAPGGSFVGLGFGRCSLGFRPRPVSLLLGVRSLGRRKPWPRAGIRGGNHRYQTDGQVAAGPDDDASGPHHGFGAPRGGGHAVGESQDSGHGQNQECGNVANGCPDGRPDEPANYTAAFGLPPGWRRRRQGRSWPPAPPRIRLPRRSG